MPTVTNERVRALIDAYGGDPMRWPAVERTEALRLAESEPLLSRAMRQAEGLDSLLDGVTPPRAGAALAGRIAAATTARKPSGLVLQGIWRWVPAAWFAAMLLLGVTTGWSELLPIDGAVAAETVAFGETAPFDGDSGLF